MEFAGPTLIAQALLVLGLVHLLTAFTVEKRHGEALIFLSLCSNVCAAFYDILVDKRAILSRRDDEYDTSNVFQVVGYKLGASFTAAMAWALSSGPLHSKYGFSISALVGATMILFLSVRVHRNIPKEETLQSSLLDITTKNEYVRPYFTIWKHVRREWPLYLLFFLYKGGESIGDVMFKPFLQDNGFNLKTIMSIGVLSDMVGILGSLSMLRKRAKLQNESQRTSDQKQLQESLLLNVVPQVLRAWVVCDKRVQRLPALIGITLLEQFIGGSVTVACFNFMFSNVLEGIEGTHFAVFSSLEVLGKVAFGALASVLVPTLGHRKTFLIAALLSVVPLSMIRTSDKRLVVLANDESLF